jgi:hypothetical protein
MRSIRFAALVVTALFITLPLAAKDFAPCAPRSATALQMAETTGWNTCQGIPSAEQVGIPAPPGGEISTLSNLGINLPGIDLLSPAPMNEIVDFYKKSLAAGEGWKWNETLQIFYRGDSVSDALFLKIPSVRISAVSDPTAESFLVDESFRDKAKTRIEIHYKPVQAANAQPTGKG